MAEEVKLRRPPKIMYVVRGADGSWSVYPVREDAERVVGGRVYRYGKSSNQELGAKTNRQCQREAERRKDESKWTRYIAGCVARGKEPDLRHAPAFIRARYPGLRVLRREEEQS